jgi:hypothetical protein
MAPHSAQLGIGADALSSHAESSTTCPMPRKAGRRAFSGALAGLNHRTDRSTLVIRTHVKRDCLTGAGGRSQGLGPPSPKGAWAARLLLS